MSEGVSLRPHPPAGGMKIGELESQSGAAIIIVLILLVLLVVMVVSLFDSSRIDQSQSNQHFEGSRAGNIARDEFDRIVALLQRTIVNPVQQEGESDEQYKKRQRHWVSSPGLLVVPEDPNPDWTKPTVDQKRLTKEIELSSGKPTAGLSYPDPIFEPAELNIQMLSEQSKPIHLVTSRPDANGNVPKMQLRWVYLREDKANNRIIRDTAQIPDLTNTAQPIIGRLAWWVDDESTKINYNLAWKRKGTTAKVNTEPASNPSNINLTALKDAQGNYLPEAMADKLHEATSGPDGRYFNSFADARQIEPFIPGISKYLIDNQLDITHYSHDPDLTFFGEERIILTTNPNLVPKDANGKPARRFLDILRDDIPPEFRDPGIRDHIDGGQTVWTSGSEKAIPAPYNKNKLQKTVLMLMEYINRNDWPVAPGKTLMEKYHTGKRSSDSADDYRVLGMRGVHVALAIIDYVRAKETNLKLMSPIRFGYQQFGSQEMNMSAKALGDAYTSQGLSRGPLLSEVGIFVSPQSDVEATDAIHAITVAEAAAMDPNAKPPAKKDYHKMELQMEFHLPESFNIPEGIDFVPQQSLLKPGFFIWNKLVDTAPKPVYWKSPDGVWLRKVAFTRIVKSEVLYGEGPNSTTLMPGKYIVVNKTFYITKPTRTLVGQMRVRLINNAVGGAKDERGIANNHLLASGSGIFRYPELVNAPEWGEARPTFWDEASAGTNLLTRTKTLQLEDPRCGLNGLDWIPGEPSLGSRNVVSPVGSRPSRTENGQQDTDADGNVTDVSSLYMPPLKGTPGNLRGRVESVGELGYIHTGLSPYAKGVPHRTLRLQPNSETDTSVVPDWVLMDLFSAPSIEFDEEDDAAGNASADAANKTISDPMHAPHGTSMGGRININSHIEPFTDLRRDRGLVALLKGAPGIPTDADAEKIAANIYNRTLSPANINGFGKAYGDSSANIFDAPGEICEIAGISDDGEEGEERLRGIANLFNVQGGVFGIYTIGQSLKQTPSGKLIITGEKRMHGVVERFRNPHGTNDISSDDKVEFKTLYLRQL